MAGVYSMICFKARNQPNLLLFTGDTRFHMISKDASQPLTPCRLNEIIGRLLNGTQIYTPREEQKEKAC